MALTLRLPRSTKLLDLPWIFHWRSGYRPCSQRPLGRYFPPHRAVHLSGRVPRAVKEIGETVAHHEYDILRDLRA